MQVGGRQARIDQTKSKELKFNMVDKEKQWGETGNVTEKWSYQKYLEWTCRQGHGVKVGDK